jgi:acyl carrier protein
MLPVFNALPEHVQADYPSIMNDMLTEIEEGKLNRILTEELDVKVDQLKPDARLDADLGADSLTKVEIGMRAEEVFQIVIPDERLEQIQTVQDIRELLTELLGRNP